MPLYYRSKAGEIIRQIKNHAKNHRIPDGLANYLLYFHLISSGVQVNESLKSELYQTMSKSVVFSDLKRYFGMNGEETVGLVYMMKGEIDNEFFERTLFVLLRKNNLEQYQRLITDIVYLVFSKDRGKVKSSLQSFYRFVEDQELFGKVVESFLYLRKLLPKDQRKQSKADQNQNFLFFGDIYEAFPAKRVFSERRLKDIFVKSMIDRDYSSFKIFRDRHFKSVSEKSDEKNEGNIMVFYLMELLFGLCYESNKADLIGKLKRFLADLDSPVLVTFLAQLLRSMEGFRRSEKEYVGEQTKASFEVLSELLLERPISLENLWNAIYSTQLTKKFEGLRFFSDSNLIEKLDLGKKLKFHFSYMSKMVLFIKNQQKFLDY